MKKYHQMSEDEILQRISQDALEFKWHPRQAQKRYKSALRQRKQGMRRLAQLRANWPERAEKKKVQVVLEFIQSHYPRSLTEAEIRQFVWEKNGGKGRSPDYYWMTVLRYPDPFQMKGKQGLLEGWCEKTGEKPNRWRLSPQVKLETPFFRQSMRDRITAREFIDVVGHHPAVDGIVMHSIRRLPWESRAAECGPVCRCEMPDDHIIGRSQVPQQYEKMFDWKRK